MVDKGTYRTAFIFGNPLKMTKQIETHGLKWPPDVPLHTAKAKRMPKAYAKPIWSTAGRNFAIRKVYYYSIKRLT
jgi:hypothetical protein